MNSKDIFHLKIIHGTGGSRTTIVGSLFPPNMWVMGLILGHQTWSQVLVSYLINFCFTF